MLSGPTRETCAQVDARDGQRCLRCGRHLAGWDGGSRHHRQLRRHGDHSTANLVLLCGSGTTGCHGWAHANPGAARAVGLIVWSHADPAEVPVWDAWTRAWYLLDREGGAHSLHEDDAMAAMAKTGHRPTGGLM